MESLESSLIGRLRNTSLPVSKCLFPIFEAVVNSILSIDERVKSEDTFTKEEAYIDVRIQRELQTSVVEGTKPDVSDVAIEDNGIGFDDNNYKSFMTLDSMYRAAIGCKGIGRLLWLKEFEGVHVSSVYSTDSQLAERRFRFNERGVDPEENTAFGEGVEQKTQVVLCSVLGEYKKTLSKYSANGIAKALFEHCQWFFLRKGGVCRIRVIDGTDVVCLDDLYDAYLPKCETSSFVIGESEFNILHVWSHLADSASTVSYCANERIVIDEKLKGIAGLYESALNHNGEMLYYRCFVTSDYLDEHVSANRFAFEIPDKPEEEQTDVFETIYFSTIQEKLQESVCEYLQPYLSVNIQEGRRKVQQFVEQKAPYYRSLLTSMKDEDITINPSSTDKNIELMLHEELRKKEYRLLEDGHDMLHVRANETEDEYRTRLEQYFSDAITLKETALAQYVINRKVFIEMLREAIQKGADGNYQKEEEVHKIIMPMRKTSNSVEFRENNLWMIDERLVFHRYLASDISFRSMPITESDSLQRPDILVENMVYDNPLFISASNRMPYTSLRIVEFKRPMRDDATNEKNPISQCIDYVEKIRTGHAQTDDGRPMAILPGAFAYCYIICDLTDSMRRECTREHLWPTYDGLGYTGYHEQLKIYFEVISYDQLLNSAEERNAVLFEKLGLPHN